MAKHVSHIIDPILLLIPFLPRQRCLAFELTPFSKLGVGLSFFGSWRMGDRFPLIYFSPVVYFSFSAITSINFTGFFCVNFNQQYFFLDRPYEL